MNDMHWLQYSHAKLKEAGVPLPDLKLEYKIRGHLEEKIENIKDSPLISLEDLQCNDSQEEKYKASKILKGMIYDAGEKSPSAYSEWFWVEKFKNNGFDFGLMKHIFLVRGNYRSVNSIYIRGNFPSWENSLCICADLGEDFIHTDTIELTCNNWPFEKIDEEKVRALNIMGPKEFIDLAIQKACELYKSFLKARAPGQN